MKIYKIISVIILVLLVGLVEGCFGGDKIGDNLKNPDQYNGKNVSVSGKWGDWQTNWEIDPVGNLTPTAYSESGKTDLILFTVPTGSVNGTSGTNKIRVKGGDKWGYGTYETRFKLLDVNFQNSTTGIYVGMGLWNFNATLQQEVMMGFYYDPGGNDYLELLTTHDRPRDGSLDPNHLYHSKLVDTSVHLSDFTNYHSIKFDYQPNSVQGYLDGNLITNWRTCGSSTCGTSTSTTKTDHIPDASQTDQLMTLVIGDRVTGGTLSSPMNAVWDYVRIYQRVSN